MKRLDFANLTKMIDEKFISVQKHPIGDLWIYNYTQKAQFDRVWNNETLQCRGLILNGKHEIVARPFPKFFNLEEAIDQGDQLPIEDFIVTEKMDGSLGILYHDVDGKPSLATRGSFNSEQAIVGTNILRKKYMDLNFDPKYTYLFEIIYPENRIVVNYGEMRDIVLLACVETATGKEKALPMDAINRIPVVKHYDGITDVKKLKELQEDNREGFVINFVNSRKRYKVKFDEYVRLHRLVTGVNAKTIWELLYNKQPFEELMERVPDEFYYWVKTTKQNLEDKFNTIVFEHRKKFVELEKQYATRKEFALHAKSFRYPGILFAMLDGKDYESIVWKMIKPKAEKPYKEEI